MKRLRVYLEPRDARMGAYIAEKAVYVCPLPFLVIRWERGTKPAECSPKCNCRCEGCNALDRTVRDLRHCRGHDTSCHVGCPAWSETP